MPEPQTDAGQANTTPPVASADVKTPMLGQSAPSDQPKDGAVKPAEPAQAGAGEPQKEGEKKEGEKAPVGAPEKYEFKLPENVKLDPESLGEFTNVAKEFDLSQDKAQKIMDLGVKHTEKVAKQIAQSQEAALKAQGEAWEKEITADPEFGGAKLTSTLEAAIRFRDKFTTPQDRDSLNILFNSAWGNHPALLRLFARAGKALGEDRTIDGSGNQNAGKTPGQIMYPSMASN